MFVAVGVRVGIGGASTLNTSFEVGRLTFIGHGCATQIVGHLRCCRVLHSMRGHELWGV